MKKINGIPLHYWAGVLDVIPLIWRSCHISPLFWAYFRWELTVLMLILIE